MSHATGVVKCKDNTLFYFEYNGTSDMNLSTLYNTTEEMHANWRSNAMPKCTCDGPHEYVEMANCYGGGALYPGKICRNCMCIVSPIHWDDFFDEEHPGLPDWWPIDEPEYLGYKVATPLGTLSEDERAEE
jgi:hypothetical protein